MKKLLIVILMLTIITGCSPKVEDAPILKETKPEDVQVELSNDEIIGFWSWFSQHGDSIYNFDIQSSDTELLDDIDERLKSIDSNLTFTIGPIKEGKRDFIISADGILTTFPYAKKLVEGASNVEKFNIIAFRPRTDITEVQFGNALLKHEQVFFKWEKEESGKISVDIFVKDIDYISDDVKSALFLLMDHAIGEYDVETKIGGIGFHRYTDREKSSIPFSEFRKVIDENYK